MSLSKLQKEQISILQQAVWDLEKAHEKILYAKGNSEIGQCYARDIAGLISNILEDIDNIHDSAPTRVHKIDGAEPPDESSGFSLFGDLR